MLWEIRYIKWHMLFLKQQRKNPQIFTYILLYEGQSCMISDWFDEWNHLFTSSHHLYFITRQRPKGSKQKIYLTGWTRNVSAKKVHNHLNRMLFTACTKKLYKLIFWLGCTDCILDKSKIQKKVHRFPNGNQFLKGTFFFICRNIHF